MSPAARQGRGRSAPRRLAHATTPTGPGLTRDQHNRYVADTMLEKVLQENVRELCVVLKLRHYHTFDSRKSAPGWPDSVIAGPHGVLVRELKRQREKPTAAQQQWLDDLAATGVNVGVWRPLDWIDGTIRRELETLAGAGGAQ